MDECGRGIARGEADAARGGEWGSYCIGTRADTGEAGRVPFVRKSLIVKKYL